MVEPPELRRRGTSRARVALRRIVALVLISGMIAAGVWAATAAIHKTRHTAPPPPSVRVRKVLKVLFPEGFTRAEMAERIAGVSPTIKAGAYLAASASSPLPGRFAGDRKPRSLEGFLFPATYDFYDNEKATRFVARQLDAFRRNWATVNLRYARSKNLTQYDVLIIASMIEKEAVVPNERPLIAAVIYNRLHARMPLAIDSTIRYALHVPGTRSLTETELRDPTPYNTRLHLGLPPTPISNPGLASMLAAAHPAKVDYLFFVAKPDKRHHFFTASQAAFNQYLATHGFGPHP